MLQSDSTLTLLCHNGVSGGVKLLPFVHHHLVIAPHSTTEWMNSTLSLSLSRSFFLKLQVFHPEVCGLEPMQWPLPFAHYSFDRVEHRAKLNRQTADVQHSCSRCYLFLLFVNIVFSVLLLWMGTERHQCCTSSIFQQAGKHTGSTWAPKTSQTNQEELACVFQWCLCLLHSHPAGASQCHAGSQAGWDENTKGNRPPRRRFNLHSYARQGEMNY